MQRASGKMSLAPDWGPAGGGVELSGRAADVGLKGWGVVVEDEPKNATTQEPGSLERRSTSFGLCCGVYATWAAENTAEAPFFCPLLINACFGEASSLFLRWLM